MAKEKRYGVIVLGMIWLEKMIQIIFRLRDLAIESPEITNELIDELHKVTRLREYSAPDLICLVDRAMPAMTGDAPALLEDLITRGFLDRLTIIFTHFEAVDAPDLDMRGRRSKVLEGLSTAIQGSIFPRRRRFCSNAQQSRRRISFHGSTSRRSNSDWLMEQDD
jgi:hypothetical protein